MSINILMPALSPTMTEGKLAKWHVKVGDAVKSGQVVCEIGVAPVKPAEFVIFRLAQFSGGTSLVSE